MTRPLLANYCNVHVETCYSLAGCTLCSSGAQLAAMGPQLLLQLLLPNTPVASCSKHLQMLSQGGQQQHSQTCAGAHSKGFY